MLPLRDHLPTRSVPFVNYALIAANVLVYGFESLLVSGGVSAEAFSHQFGLVPVEFLADPIANASSLFTHMFVHGGFAHVAGNMLYLWIFGDNVEDALGHLRYAIFYFACGLAAAFAQVAFSVSSAVPMIGASGAIAGVLAAYAVYYPRSPITVLNPIFLLWFFWGPFLSLPAWFVIAAFFGVNLWSAFQAANGAGQGGVAFMAHVGGFLAGLVLQRALRKEPAPGYDQWNRFVDRRDRRLERGER